jgi:hypothetical protein
VPISIRNSRTEWAALGLWMSMPFPLDIAKLAYHGRSGMSGWGR